MNPQRPKLLNLRHGIGTLVLCVAAAACGDAATAPIAPPAPTPGIVDVYLSTPNANDRATLVHVTGNATGFVTAPGIQQFAGTGTASAALLIVAAAPLPQGDIRIGSFTVPDTSRMRDVAMTITEVAGADYRLRESLAGYDVRLVLR